MFRYTALPLLLVVSALSGGFISASCTNGDCDVLSFEKNYDSWVCIQWEFPQARELFSSTPDGGTAQANQALARTRYRGFNLSWCESCDCHLQETGEVAHAEKCNSYDASQTLPAWSGDVTRYECVQAP